MTQKFELRDDWWIWAECTQCHEWYRPQYMGKDPEECWTCRGLAEPRVFAILDDDNTEAR